MNMKHYGYTAGLAVLLAALVHPNALAQNDLARQSRPRLELGANVNESLGYLDLNLLARSQTTWIRGFLPASEFIRGKRNLASDPGLLALRQCAQEGRKVLLTLKWDFREAGWAVPQADSQRERESFAWVDATLDQMHEQLSILALVNEVIVDTDPADLQADAAGRIPMVTFLQRLADHIAARAPQAPRGLSLPLYCGGFTRLDTVAMQTNPATLALMKWCNADTRIAGVSFHLHQDNFQQYEQALAFIRRHIPAKPLAVTEFSLIWNYQAHLEDSLDANEAGKTFVRKQHLAPGTTVRGFINQCMTQPVPEATWAEFLRSQSWFDPEFLRHSCDLMEREGVVIATYAFSQHSSGGAFQLHRGGTPWLLNPIYIPLVAVSDEPNQTAVNSIWFAEYLRRQSRFASTGLGP